MKLLLYNFRFLLASIVDGRSASREHDEEHIEYIGSLYDELKEQQMCSKCFKQCQNVAIFVCDIQMGAQMTSVHTVIFLTLSTVTGANRVLVLKSHTKTFVTRPINMLLSL